MTEGWQYMQKNMSNLKADVLQQQSTTGGATAFSDNLTLFLNINLFTAFKWLRQLPDLNSLGTGGTGECTMLSFQHGPKSPRNVSITVLNLYHKELKQH